MSGIAASLKSIFEKHRIIVWYDEEKYFKNDFDSLDLDDVEKYTILNNEFALKYKMLIQEPEKKFLLYANYTRPENEDNWLLDIELSNHLFHSDREALTLQSVGLPIQYRGLIKDHIDFFSSQERIRKFQSFLPEEVQADSIVHAMLQTVFNALQPVVDDYLRIYSTAFIQGKAEEIEKELTRFGLADLFWQSVRNKFLYESEEPAIYDFLVQVFQKNSLLTDNVSSVNKATAILLSKWKDTSSFEIDFKEITKKIASDLHIKRLLESFAIEDIKSEDLYEEVERFCIQYLTDQLLHDAIDHVKVERLVKDRSLSQWYSIYEYFYKSIQTASLFFDQVQRYKDFKIASLEAGFERYTKDWFAVDQSYRLFLQNYRKTNQNNVLNSLYQKVHKAYSNQWLIQSSNAWQSVLNDSTGWYGSSKAQSRFFTREVAPIIEKGNKLFVIISDALRYECGEELHRLLNAENRFASKLDYQVSVLPSYTQLGMAALLPHNTLFFDKKDNVLINDKSTLGLSSREKILKEYSGVRAKAILAEDVMKMSSRSQDARELVKDHDLIYIYHNRIDKVGDDKTQEEKVVEAAETEIQFLMDLVRKIINMNGSQMIITSDHGFIYQHEPIEESDFFDAGISGEVVKLNRRFVLGRDLKYDANVQKFEAADLGIASDMQILIPKGIGRLRVQGAGSRFVHGGASLQETVLPMLFVSKRGEKYKLKKVEVDVLNKASNRITTNIHVVKFYQTTPTDAMMKERTLKAYFMLQKETGVHIISDVYLHSFDVSSSHPNDREKSYTFTLSANTNKKQEVFLVLEERIEDSSQWQEYKRFSYNVDISMASDFDDF